MLGTRARAGSWKRDRANQSRVSPSGVLMVQQHDAAGDFLWLTKKISSDRGFGCASYKEKCLRRRIAVRMRARGVHTYSDYARILHPDATGYDRRTARPPPNRP